MQHADIAPAPTQRGVAALWRRCGALSLRHRFLLAPLLGLLLLGAVTAAFIAESRAQNDLLRRIATHELEAHDRYAEAAAVLSAEHVALHRLLYDTRSLDEAMLYDAAKQRLNAIHQAIARLEQSLPDGSNQTASLGVLRDAVLQTTLRYRSVVTSAIAVVTVDLSRAPTQLAAANDAFADLHHALDRYLTDQRRLIRIEIDDRVQRGERANLVNAVFGVGAALGLLALSLLLSRLLARSLEQRMQSLIQIGEAAGQPVALDGRGDELSRISRAIDSFRALVLHLEQRVQERTAALQDANSELRCEIELRKDAERALKIYAEVIRCTGEAVAITDLDGRILEINPAYEDAIGRARHELVGTPVYGVARERDSHGEWPPMWAALEAEGRWTGEILDRRGNGELFPSWALINAVHDEDGERTHYVCVSRDITAIKQSERQLQKLAFFDPLTSLPNRALFEDRLNVALAGAQRAQQQVALMYIDLDHFKDVNDSLGHPMGDRLLVEVAQRVSQCIRATDSTARMGGDEFTVLLTQLADERDATQVAQRIIEALRVPVKLGDEMVRIGASIGLAYYPRDGIDAQTLHKHADLAMYEAKSAGRNQFRVFSEQLAAHGNARLALNAQLEAALENNEFTLSYQPIVSVDSGRVSAVEALIRWQRAGGEIVSPATFIPHAESTGFIRRIDLWVVERACLDAQTWNVDGSEPLRLCVNLSAVTVQQPNLPQAIADVLQRTGMPPARLTLEITETAVIADPYAAQNTLEALMALGVGVSVDDFGTGYASLSYLTRFPIDCIKLDRSFIDGIGRDPASEAVIRSVLELARKLQLSVVAEGIEQTAQRNFLGDAGCEMIQGYQIARPMPLAKLHEWLANERANAMPTPLVAPA